MALSKREIVVDDDDFLGARSLKDGFEQAGNYHEENNFIGN